MKEIDIVEQIINPKLTRDKYIELRLKGRTKKQICEQWGIRQITQLSNWGLGRWEPDMPIPDKPSAKPNKDTNKDTVLIKPSPSIEPAYSQLSPSLVETLDKNHFTDVTNMVEHPPHYTAGGIECIDAIMAAVTGLSPQEAVCVANVIKYTWRFKHKNGKQDLKKAEWYLKRLHDLQEGDGASGDK